MPNYHDDPRELIIEAAERSGLLKEVAYLIWFAKQYGTAPRCPICELVDELTEAFDDHICTPGIVGEHVYGDGHGGGPSDIAPAPGAEAAEFEIFYANFCTPDQAKLEESR